MSIDRMERQLEQSFVHSNEFVSLVCCGKERAEPKGKAPSLWSIYIPVFWRYSSKFKEKYTKIPDTSINGLPLLGRWAQP